MGVGRSMPLFVFIYQTEITSARPTALNIRPARASPGTRCVPHPTRQMAFSHTMHTLSLNSLCVPPLPLSTISPPPSHSFPLAAFCLSVILSPSESAMPCVFDRIRI